MRAPLPDDYPLLVDALGPVSVDGLPGFAARVSYLDEAVLTARSRAFGLRCEVIGNQRRGANRSGARLTSTF